MLPVIVIFVYRHYKQIYVYKHLYNRYTNIHIYVYTNINTHIYLHIYMYIFKKDTFTNIIYIYICANTFINIYTYYTYYIYIYKCMYIYIYIYSNVYTYINVYVYVHTSIYIYILYIIYKQIYSIYQYLSLSLSFFRPPESIQTDCGPKRAWENNQELIIQKVPAKFIKFYIYLFIHTSRGIAWNCALQSKASVRLQSVAQQIGLRWSSHRCAGRPRLRQGFVKFLAPICGRMP